MDSAQTTTTDWWFMSDGEQVTADPDGSLVLPGLLLAETMILAIPHLQIGPLEFDLCGLFETPVQGNIDHCGHYADSA